MKQVLAFRSTVVGLTLLSLALLAVPSPGPPVPAYAARPAGISAAGTSGLTVVNLDEVQPATVVVDFYNQGGGVPVSLTMAQIPAGNVGQVNLPTRSELPNGAYAATVMSDRSIATVARTEWAASGGTTVYNQSLPSTDVLLPLVAKYYYGQTSLVTIQNTDPSAQAIVEFSLYMQGETVPSNSVQYPIGPGTSITLDLAKSAEFVAIPGGFLGAARVLSATPVAVQSFVDVENSEMGVYAFEGVPAEEAADRLYVPMTHSRRPVEPGDPTSPTRSSMIAVMNPGPGPASVTLSHRGLAGTCVGQTITHGPVSLEVNGSAVFDQSGIDMPLTGVSPLPANCLASTVIETGTGLVAAVAVDAVNTGRPSVLALAGAHNAFNSDESALKTILPLFRRNHMGFTTGIYAMNASPTEASAMITFFDGSGREIVGCGADCTATIEQYAAHFWWPADIPAIPDGTSGHALIESTQPLAVTVSDESIDGRFDTSIFNGVKADVSGSPPMQRMLSHVPLLLQEAGGGPPPRRTPTLTPTVTPTPTPAPEVGLPAAIPARAGGQVRVPIDFAANGYDIGSVEFTLDIDEEWVSFDPTDTDGDGIPDSVHFYVSKLFERVVTYDPAETAGELTVAIRRRGPDAPALPDGTLVDITLDIGERSPKGAGGPAVRFGAPPEFKDSDGNEIGGRTRGDQLRVPEADLSLVYLPFSRKKE